MSDNFIYSRDGFGLKHSPNIIDILEIGDLLDTEYGWGWYHSKIDEKTIAIDDDYDIIEVTIDEIDKILTREMMETNSYKVK